MKKPFYKIGLSNLLIALAALLNPIKSQAQTSAIHVVNVTDAAYGAIPNDTGPGSNDQEAFERATDAIKRGMINKGGTWQLVIPAGAYFVGKQVTGRSQYKLGISPIAINLEGVIYDASLQILGVGAHITYVDDLFFGAFDDNGNPYSTTAATTDYRRAASIGGFIDLRHCHDVAIQGLEVDGNNQHLRTGSPFGDVDYQLDHDGIFLADCSNVSISNVTMNHFGRDGLQVFIKTDETAFGDQAITNNISVSGCHFDYNGRDGLSWVGGKGLNATNTSFNHSGRTINTNPNSLHPNTSFGSNPRAGVNVEPQGGFYARNLAFHSCEIADNTTHGFVSDGTSPFDLKAEDISFDDCTVYHTTSTGPAVYNVRPHVRFTNCNIYGRIQSCYYATNDPDKATKFIDCSIEDKSYQGQPVATGDSNVPFNSTDFLLAMYARTQSTLFQNCQFTINKLGLNDSYNRATPSSSWTVFRNCTFNIKWTARNPLTNFFTGATFEGNNAFVDGLPGGMFADNTIRIPLALVTSDRADPSKHTLTIATGPHLTWVFDDNQFDDATNDDYHAPSDGTLTVGKDATDEAALVIDNGSYFYNYGGGINPRNTLISRKLATTINEKGIIIVRGHSTFRVNDACDFNIKGRFILENQGILDVRQLSTWIYGPESELYIGKNATVIGYSGGIPDRSLFYFATCVHGGNTGINSAPCTEGLALDGHDDYVVAQDDNNKANFGTGPFTMEAFFNIYVTPKGQVPPPINAHFISKATYSGAVLTSGFDFGLNDSGAYLNLPNQHFIAEANTRSGCNHLVVSRSNSGKITFYLNELAIGVFEPGRKSVLASVASTAPVYLGGNVNKESLHGILNEVRLWKVERTEAELQQYSDASQVTIDPDPTKLSCYWSLRQNTTNQEVADLASVYPWERSSGFRGAFSNPAATDLNEPSWVAAGAECQAAVARMASGVKSSTNLQQETGDKAVSSTVIYPNPFNKEANIIVSASSEELADVTVLEPNGRVILHLEKVPTNRSQVFGQQLAAGLYFVRVVQGNQIKTLKLIKQ